MRHRQERREERRVKLLLITAAIGLATSVINLLETIIGNLTR